METVAQHSISAATCFRRVSDSKDTTRACRGKMTVCLRQDFHLTHQDALNREKVKYRLMIVLL